MEKLNFSKGRDIIQIINYNDSIYPLRLKEIPNPPQKLYAKGNLELLNQTNIAIVGARSCSEYGRKTAQKLAKQLSSAGANIISGMAVGIDTEAHTGCLKNGGHTIAVLPCGFENIFPKENIELYNSIISSGGLVITEYPPNTEANMNTFTKRNRIVAGLSICVIVVEASHRSGTSITAHFALEQGKKVFCVPGNIDSKYSVGTNKLIQNGANLLMSANDITKQYKFLKKCREKKLASKIPDKHQELYNKINETPIFVDELKRKLNISIADLTFQLTELEMDGFILKLPGGSYVRNE